jgi:hypothetical protein
MVVSMVTLSIPTLFVMCSQLEIVIKDYSHNVAI